MTGVQTCALPIFFVVFCLWFQASGRNPVTVFWKKAERRAILKIVYSVRLSDEEKKMKKNLTGKLACVLQLILSVTLIGVIRLLGIVPGLSIPEVTFLSRSRLLPLITSVSLFLFLFQLLY